MTLAERIAVARSAAADCCPDRTSEELRAFAAAVAAAVVAALEVAARTERPRQDPGRVEAAAIAIARQLRTEAGTWRNWHELPEDWRDAYRRAATVALAEAEGSTT